MCGSLLALLDRGVGRLEVLVALEALGDLLRQVSVGHGVPEDGDAFSALAEQRRDMPWSGFLPLPVRTAQTATTGFDDVSIVSWGDSSRSPPGRERARRDVHHVLGVTSE